MVRLNQKSWFVRQKVLGANIHETEGLLERNIACFKILTSQRFHALPFSTCQCTTTQKWPRSMSQLREVQAIAYLRNLEVHLLSIREQRVFDGKHQGARRASQVTYASHQACGLVIFVLFEVWLPISQPLFTFAIAGRKEPTASAKAVSGTSTPVRNFVC